ncbi:phosphoinositide phosphatase [Neofusicoccum parvum]|uniref:phosphoinositide 5-phosphatase n=2 Tax=Neofusicoccum parvum TaxID=310453 RepID=R1EXS4_BOTPV|nr:putative synaptojanin 2 protein [Neofusicoccum parvum UCRNP2]GME24702.1 phosphoinositide phosphatase [Neofusicoccum parvum]GME52027.1 phosphoinositide phosphatase [Neofusicoccum parvum]
MSSNIRVLIRDHPHRSIALATDSHVLVFRHTPSSADRSANGFYPGSGNTSQTSLSSAQQAQAPRCMVEFSDIRSTDLSDYRNFSTQPVHGTLGLITVNNDVFLCVVSAASRAAMVRPGETVQKILAVDFHCLNRSDYDHILYDEVNPYPTDTVDEEGFEQGYGRREPILEHPCMALKKLLSSGTFYYSSDFDLTRRMQDRSYDESTVALDSLDAGFLWNSYMIQPLVNFRSRLSQGEKEALDASGILTSAIRGFASTFNVPAASSPARNTRTGLPSTMTLISRLSCRRAGTRFNARGMDDDGNVANFVETETIFWTPDGVCFSYVQVRGSVPIFWEQQPGLLPGQQKVSITRSPEATQPAFDKHMENLELAYGPVHVVNLLSAEKPSEVEISDRYRYHIRNSSLNDSEKNGNSRGHELLTLTEYDFHAETRGPAGYEAASMISRYIRDSAEGFAYYLGEEVEERPKTPQGEDQIYRRSTTILQQEGIFRTNCLDCLDRTNLVQTIVSQIVAVGFQEIVELSPQQIMSTDPARRQKWEAAVKRTLNDHAQRNGQEEYVSLRGGQLVGASLSVFVKASILKYIKNVEGSLKKTGMSGMAGNKGAVAIRMEYANTSICFVTAHLAAGFANYDERNRDYRTISHGLRFQRNRSIEDHDTVIWLGDFNYRIGLNNEKVRKLVEVGDFETLYENDQLNLQMVAGLTFPFYSEARITFPPTYKYDLGTDTYDTS